MQRPKPQRYHRVCASESRTFRLGSHGCGIEIDVHSHTLLLLLLLYRLITTQTTLGFHLLRWREMVSCVCSILVNMGWLRFTSTSVVQFATFCLLYVVPKRKCAAMVCSVSWLMKRELWSGGATLHIISSIQFPFFVQFLVCAILCSQGLPCALATVTARVRLVRGFLHESDVKSEVKVRFWYGMVPLLCSSATAAAWLVESMVGWLVFAGWLNELMIAKESWIREP